MSTSRQARRIAMSDGHFRRGRRERDTRLIAPNPLEANRKGRLPYFPGYCERRPAWMVPGTPENKRALAVYGRQTQVPRNVAEAIIITSNPAT